MFYNTGVRGAISLFRPLVVPFWKCRHSPTRPADVIEAVNAQLELSKNKSNVALWPLFNYRVRTGEVKDFRRGERLLADFVFPKWNPEHVKCQALERSPRKRAKRRLAQRVSAGYVTPNIFSEAVRSTAMLQTLWKSPEYRSRRTEALSAAVENPRLALRANLGHPAAPFPLGGQPHQSLLHRIAKERS